MMTLYPRIVLNHTETAVIDIVKSIYPTLSPEGFELSIIEPEGHSMSLAQIKDLRQMIQSSGARSRVIVFDSFEKATDEAQNALLKILEEMGEVHAFFLITHSIDSVLPTIRSRCQIVYLDQKNQHPVDSVLTDLIMRIHVSSGAQLLADERFTVSSMEEAQTLLESIICSLREQIRQGDKWYVELARYAMELLQLSKRNNLNPQLSIDAWVVRAVLTASKK